MRQPHQASRPSPDEAATREREYVLSLGAAQLARLIGGDPLLRDDRGREGAQGPGPGHSPHDRSMVVRIDPASPDGFNVQTFSPRDEWRTCKDHVRDRTGLSPRRAGTTGMGHATCSRSTQTSGGAADSRRDTRETAAWLWSKSQVATGTPVEAYLKSRRIAPTDTVRHLPADPPRYPHHAMIVPLGFPEEPEPGRLIVSPTVISAVHLTLIRADGSGKAECRPSKKRVGRGTSVPIVIAPPNDSLGLVIAEGVEDALSIHLATGLGAWAAGGATFPPALANAVPDYMDIVTVASHPEPSTGVQHSASYLPADDRRHYVVWSEVTKEDFEDDYWHRIWAFYDEGGVEHVAAFLSVHDLGAFSATARHCLPLLASLTQHPQTDASAHRECSQGLAEAPRQAAGPSLHELPPRK